MARGLAGAALAALAVLSGCRGPHVALLAVGPSDRWRVEHDGAAADAAGWRGPYAFRGVGSSVDIDLGRQAMIGGAVLEWADGAPPAAYRIMISGKGREWTTVATMTSDGGLDYAAWRGTMGRRIRIGMVRPEVSGTVPQLERIAVLDRTCPATVRCGEEEHPDGLAWLDGDPATVWEAPGGEAVVDLGKTLAIGSVRLTWGEGDAEATVDVAVSGNGAQWAEWGAAEAQGGGGFDVVMGREVAAARWIRLRAAEGSPLRLAEVTVRGKEGVAAGWTAYSTAAQRAGDASYPGSARGKAAAWTRVAGVGGSGAEGLMNAEGGVSPGRHLPGLWAVLELADGRVLHPGSAPEREFGTGAPGAPMPEGRWRWPEEGVELRIRGLSRPGEVDKKGTVWFRYDVTATGAGGTEGKLSWMLRPAQIPGEEAGGGWAPIGRLSLAESEKRQTMRADGRILWASAGGGLEAAAATFEGGDIGGKPRGRRDGKEAGEKASGEGAEEDKGKTGRRERGAKKEVGEKGRVWGTEVKDEVGLASGKWSMGFSLGAGESAGRVLAGSVGVKKGSQAMWPEGGAGDAMEAFEKAWGEESWAWRRRLESGSPSTGEAKGFVALAAAQLGWLGAEGPGPADTEEGGGDEEWTWRTAALLRSGQSEAGLACLERMLEERAAGEATAEGAGMFAFLAMEGWRFEGDMGFLKKAYPEIRRGMEAVEKACRWKKKRSGWQRWRGAVEGDGLLPAGADGRRRYSDDYWALLGWKETRSAAAALGKDDDAAWAEEKYRELKRALKASLSAATRGDSRLPTGPDGRREDAMRSAADAALLVWPCGEVEVAGESVVASSLDAAYREFLTRRRMGGRVGGDEARLWLAMARMGRAAEAHEWMFEWTALAGKEGWGALPSGWVLDRRGEARAEGWRPNLRVAALFALAVRQMAVAEDGEQLRLLEGVPPECLRGAGLSAAEVPTAFGTLSLKARRGRLGYRVEIGGGVRPPGGFWLAWPYGETPTRVDLNERTLPEQFLSEDGIRLPDTFKGTVTARFSGEMEDLRDR